MAEQTEEFRSRIRRFLNTSRGRDVDPKEILEDLVSQKVLDAEEAGLVENEKTKTNRQFSLFLVILPTKGQPAKEAVSIALRRQGFTAAAEKWEKLIPKDEPDPPAIFKGRAPLAYKKSTIHYLQHAELYSTPSEPEVPEQLEEAAHVEEQGAPPPIGFVYGPPPPLEAASPPALPPEPVISLLRTNLLRAGNSQYAHEPPGQVLAQSFEERVDVVFTSGVGVSPPLRATSTEAGEDWSSSSDGSKHSEAGGIPKGDSIAEGSLNPKDIVLDQEIGRGFFAVAYLAQFNHRKVAVKKFRDYDEFSLAMFIEEVTLMKALNHRNVVKFVGFVHSPHDRQLWLLTEFIPGGAMRRFCTPASEKRELEKSLSLRDKVKISMDCWQGLDYIHGLNLCHKDISPGNILVSNDLTQVKISDFGLSEFKTLLATAVTQISGTAMYYPPEFASEHGVIRHPTKSDIYSMGASLCELFSEEWYWNINGKARNQFQVMFKISEQHRLWDEKHEILFPDCWCKVPSVVQATLKDAIMPDHKQRKSAHELCLSSQELLKNL